MSTIEEISLMEYLENMPFDYRETLNVNPNDKFGVEIEFISSKRRSLDKVYKIINFKPYEKKVYRLASSKRIVAPKSEEGIHEIKTPVLENNSKDLMNFKRVCDGLSKEDIIPGNQKGVHVHVDLSNFMNDPYYLKLFLKVFCVYEHIISRFSYGEEDYSNINYASYSREISNLLYDFIRNHTFDENFEDLITDLRHILNFKSYALNFHQKDSSCRNETIEFRTFNGTFNPTIIENDVNMCLNIVDRIVNNELDIDLIDYKFSEYNRGFYKKRSYSKLNMDDAIEFSDLIFNYNKDKDYFLRQYAIKSNPRKKKLVI